jgi:hypothetical protein
VWPLELPQLEREGALPAGLSAREALIDALFDWTVDQSRDEAARGGRSGAGLLLYRGDRRLYDAHDGLPATLWLSAEEFRTLQDRWRQEGLPADLFFPAAAAREVVEPTEVAGGVVLLARTYSPGQWARRPPGAAPPLPSEDARRAQFLDACDRFVEALLLRQAQLREPGRPPAAALLAALTRVVADLQRLRLYERTGRWLNG